MLLVFILNLYSTCLDLISNYFQNFPKGNRRFPDDLITCYFLCFVRGIVLGFSYIYQINPPEGGLST